MRKRDKWGQFTQKSEEPREVRSIRLTESAWKKLGDAAATQGITRADLLEQMAESGAFDSPLAPQTFSLRSQAEEIIEKLLVDPNVTRNGKDRSAVKRTLEALLNQLPT